MDTFRANQVFTPSSLAESSFIERDHKINSQIVDSLRTPGKQIVIYGYSGCGKSTLIMNKLNQAYENEIVSRCMKGMTLENLIADGFDQLQHFITDEEKQQKFSINPKISVEYNDIKASFSLVDYSSQTTTAERQLLPPQLTARRLGQFFGEAKCCWVLEDFHKIQGEEKQRVSQIMKVFMDMAQTYPDLKIIAIGAVGTAREVVQYDHEMNNRISEVLIPPMSNEEIIQIIQKGEELLNVRFPSDLKRKISEYSCGIPSICHQLCLNMCFINDITETQKHTKAFDDEDLEIAVEKFISERSDSLKQDYELALKNSEVLSTDIIRSVLSAALRTTKNEFNTDSVHRMLQEEISIELTDHCLRELSSVERGELLIFTEASGLYRFNNLFIKNYVLMNLVREDQTSDMIILKDKREIDRLLDIIHKDLSDEFEELISE